MVPSHNLKCRPGSAVDLYCFIQETVLTQIFKALVVSLRQPAELVIPCPVELVKVRLPRCQLGDVNRASSQRISQPVASKWHEVDLRCSLKEWGCGSQRLQTVSWFFYSVLVPLRALQLLGYTGTCWLHVRLPRAAAPSACRQKHHCRSGCHSNVCIYKERQIQGGSSGDISDFSAHTHTHTHT